MHDIADVVSFLLGAVRSVSATRGVRTSLHHAAGDGDVVKIRQLLTTSGAVNAGDEYGKTPLMYAAWHGRAEAVNCLLINGADCSLVDCNGWNALHCAAMRGDPNTITTLISAGVHPNTRNNKGETPLMIAASWAKADALDTLAAAGGDMSITDNDGCTVLHHAAAAPLINNVNILEKLIDSYKCNINTKNNKGETPLRVAINKKNKKVIDYLKQKGGRE